MVLSLLVPGEKSLAGGGAFDWSILRRRCLELETISRSDKWEVFSGISYTAVSFFFTFYHLI